MTPADDLPALPDWIPAHLHQNFRDYALAARAERDKQWSEWGVIEVAVRNHSVAEYMRHWEGRAEAAEARVKNLEKALDPYDHALLKQRDTFQARVEALERQLKIAEHDSVHQSQLYSEYIEEWTKERDTLQKRVAELEERLIVMCVAQLNQWSDGLSEIKSLVAGDYFGAWDSVEASNPRRNRILDLCDGLLGNIPSRPSPDPPDPAPLKEGEVQSIDHLDSIGED